IPLRNINLTVVLPLGATYIPGTLLMDDVAIEEPIITDNMLAIRLDIMGEEFMTVITLKTALKEMRKEQLLEARAMLAFDTPSQRHQMTPVAVNVIDIFDYDIKKEKLPEFTLRPHFPVLGTELSESDKEELDKIVAEVEGTDVVSIFVVGHTSSVLISEKNRHLFADNYALSLARAESVADYFKDKLTLHATNIISEGKGFDEPVATNDTKEGKALNRRVEVRLLTEKAYRKYMATDTRVNSEEVSVATYSKRGALLWEDERDNEARDHSKFTVESMRRNLSPDDKPGFEWFFPDENVYPPIARYSPSVKHEAGMKVVLYLDGEEVNPVYFEGIDKNSGNTVLLSNWRGVVLSEGDNLFAAVGVDKDGNEVERIERVVHYSTAPVVAKLMEERSRLTADGKTVPIIAIRLTDKDGHPARKGIVGEFSVEEPYRAHRRIEELDLAPMLGRDKVMSQYLVEDDGTIYLELEPTSESGEAVVRINLASGVHEIRPYIIAQARELILVGIAEGTLAYDTIDGNMVAAKASGAEEDIHEEGRLAFYAKGSIKGEYLLTVAFDSESGTEEDRQKLHGIIDPGTYYTVYGDATEQRYEGTSSEKLYLKIEKGKFYALFGDYRTGLTVTKLSRYNRSLTGFKTEAHGENYEIKAFASQTHQSFMRDELRGDGTSGLYYLSLGGIVENSEKIIIETRDRTRSEVIVSSRALTRHIDYDINYDDSSIYFKEPIASRDVSFNPIYIVVDYESYDPVGDAWNYGGRIGYNFKEHKVKAGATVVHEGTVGGSGDLLGIDVAYELTKYSTLSAEMARTEKEFYNVRSSGDAYLVELSRDGKKLDLRAYFREQEGTFGLGQQNGTESDTRKYGIEGVYQSSDRLAYSWLAFRDINLSTDSERTVAEAKASYRNTGYSGFVGLRRAVDLFKGFDDKVSTQLMLGGTLDVLKGKVKLKLQHDQSIFGANENADYPTRTTFGVDYIINNYVTLFGVQEFTYGKDKESNSTRAGFRSTPWRGSDVTSSVGRQFNENGERVFTNTGLRQAYNISEKFSLNGSFEKSDTIKDLNAPKHNLNVPSSSADPDDFTAISLGASYKAIDWGLSARVDYRVSPLQIKRTIFAGVYGEVREGLGVTFSYLEGRVENEVQPDSHNINVRVGTVYRPLFGKWTLLDKFDYVLHEDSNTAMEFAEKKLVNNLNVNYKLNRETQIAFQYGSRYVVDHIDGIEFEGYTDLMGVEARRDLTNNFDIGLYASLLRTFETGVTDHRVGASFGYSFATNMWLSLGYNIAGFEDEDFSNGDYTSKGPFIRFRLKFDQNSLNSTMKWLGGFNSDK
ncbi:MAG: OmpA family protein, partial [Deltaproteobacteria bacterium]|nr:OmpA family protein [Deltaproteobacteria bacterium]